MVRMCEAFVVWLLRFIISARFFSVIQSLHFSFPSNKTAAYLTHGELARWELTSYNGMLQCMLQHQVHFLVVGTSIRYRKELRPLFGKFQIDTTVCGLDERNLWILHKFRTINEKKESRMLAQLIVQGVAVEKGRTIMNPVAFLKDKVGFDSDLIDSIIFPHKNQEASNESEIMEELFSRYSALEESMKRAAAQDDKRHT
jgi:acyl-CoA thioesterase FadM